MRRWSISEAATTACSSLRLEPSQLSPAARVCEVDRRNRTLSEENMLVDPTNRSTLLEAAKSQGMGVVVYSHSACSVPRYVSACVLCTAHNGVGDRGLELESCCCPWAPRSS
jgi:hypothetical protein